MKKQLLALMGQPVAILGARYFYRGIVAAVDDDVVTLSDPRAVELTGRSVSTAPTREDIIPSDLHIALGVIEKVMQPTWCFAGYGIKKGGKNER